MQLHKTKGNTTMGSLLADMNHDIRTSMNGVRGMLELLLDTGLTPSQQQYARAAQHSADALLESIERVVDMSLIESNNFRFNQAPFDLLQEMQVALAGKPATASALGIELSIHYPPCVRLIGDAARLREAVSALGDLALHCTAGERLAIVLGATYISGGSCRITFDARASQLSEDGARMASTLKRTIDASLETTGSGGKEMLGMALCGRLVQMMNGSISVDHATAPGAVFCISIELPLAADAPRGAQSPNLSDHAGGLAPSGATPAPVQKDGGRRSTFSGYNILVADDNPVNQQVAARMLEKLGCACALAADGMQAVDMHIWKRFDLILMDCDMPMLDGLEATQRIRTSESAGQRTPIIALTACTGQGEQERCIAAGMDDFLSKPIRPQMLADVLARWLPQPAPATEATSVPACEDELEEVKEMFGADFAELSALYQNDGPPRLAALHEAFAAGDCAKVAKVAHAFAGSSASIGATGLSALCKSVETSAKAGSLDDFVQRMAAIETEYRRVCGKLQSLLTR